MMHGARHAEAHMGEGDAGHVTLVPLPGALPTDPVDSVGAPVMRSPDWFPTALPLGPANRVSSDDHV